VNNSKSLEVIKQTSSQFDTDLGKLDQVLSWFELLNHSFIPRKDWLHCQLALAEGFTNAVRHAHKETKYDLKISIKITLFVDRLEIRIWDYGEPFNLHKHIKNLAKMHQNQTDGKRGLLILEQITDHLDYSRTEDQNCLLMVKNFDSMA
jgi:serine/threonine-protein kinase RsbW